MYVKKYVKTFAFFLRKKCLREHVYVFFLRVFFLFYVKDFYVKAFFYVKNFLRKKILRKKFFTREGPRLFRWEEGQVRTIS